MRLINHRFLNLPAAKLRLSKDNFGDGYQGIRGTRGMKWRWGHMTGDGWTVFAIHKCNSALSGTFNGIQ